MTLRSTHKALMVGCLGLSIMSITSLHSRKILEASLVNWTKISEGAIAGTGESRPGATLPDDKDRPDSFSACLMWMDDNFRLYEWLAYHYYMLNLRYVVIHMDPKSRTSPNPVLDMWRDRIHFVVWSCTSNFTNKTYEVTEENAPASRVQHLLSELYVRRQEDFYLGCAAHLRARNRSWTAFHDSDEFLVATEPSNVSIQEIEDEPGSLFRVFQRYSKWHDNADVVSRYNESDFSQFEDWDLWFSARPCIVLPRLLFGAVESNDTDVREGVPSFLDPYRFDTFRWRIQGTPQHASDGPGKSFVDLSRLPSSVFDEISNGTFQASAHKVFLAHCTHSWPTGHGPPLKMNHYLGTWEAYSYRDDVRKAAIRSYQKWEKQAAGTSGGINDLARPWIKGFVRMVGEENAIALLRNAGLPRNYTKPANETAGWFEAS